jgi:two-component system NtrC family sensor kinase
MLREMRQQLRLDFLILLDSNGRVRAATGGPDAGRDHTQWEVVRRALSGHAEAEVDIFDAAQLTAIDPLLAERARTPLIVTRNAQPTQRSEEVRGMVMHAAAPLASTTREGGASTGVLVGGLLLNKNLDIVDRINEIVYPEGSLPLGSVGTATLFLDDVRIATNVRLFEGVRAIGTRVSAAVRHTALDLGRTWLDRAFVVNDWYVSAYEPIADSRGKRVGMLYVGYLEEPFQRARWFALAAVAMLFAITVAIAALVSLRLARHVSQTGGTHARHHERDRGGRCRRPGSAPSLVTWRAKMNWPNWRPTSTACWTGWPSRPMPCSVGGANSTARWRNAPGSWRWRTRRCARRSNAW